MSDDVTVSLDQSEERIEATGQSEASVTLSRLSAQHLAHSARLSSWLGRCGLAGNETRPDTEKHEKHNLSLISPRTEGHKFALVLIVRVTDCSAVVVVAVVVVQSSLQ